MWQTTCGTQTEAEIYCYASMELTKPISIVCVLKMVLTITTIQLLRNLIFIDNIPFTHKPLTLSCTSVYSHTVGQAAHGALSTASQPIAIRNREKRKLLFDILFKF